MADLHTIKGSGRWADGDAAKSDTVDLAEVPRAVTVLVAGNVKMNDANGVPQTFYFAAGQERALHPRRIFSTLTTATGIVLLY